MSTTPPNILFILIDDLGARDLGCYGSTFYETPTLDRLAREGMLFDRAYASCPVCSPTRASIMSGKYPARVGVTQFIGGDEEGKLESLPYLHYLPLAETSVASALREGGYQTWHVGKWHLGDEPFYPEHHGFDINVGGCHWGMPYKGFFSPWHIPNLPDVPPGTYLTDYLTDEACRLIREREDRPFFLNLSHYAVHIPIQAPEPLVEKYRAKAKALHLDEVNPFVIGEPFSNKRLAGQRLQRRVLQSDPAYAAMIENLDTNISRVLSTLEDEGILDDTLIVFTADNGGLSTAQSSPTCNLPLAEGKGWCKEGGNRVCQLMRWPGIIAPGSRCRENVTSTDFYPTLLDAARLPHRPEQHVDGVSLMPLLRGAQSLEREAIFWHYPHYAHQGDSPFCAVLAGDWKLIEHFEDGTLTLHNLATDPGEICNLAACEPERTRQLHQLLRDWRNDVEARVPGPNPNGYTPVTPDVPNNACE